VKLGRPENISLLMNLSWLEPKSLKVYVSSYIRKKLIINIEIIKLKSHAFDTLILVKNNIYSKYKSSEKNKF
jgi:hypothetical protein